MCIASASFCRSHRRSRLQQPLTLAFYDSGLGERSLDTLNALFLSMSPSWLHRVLDTLSEKETEAMLAAIKKYLLSIGYDNINALTTVVQQRVTNRQKFESGTVGAIHVHTSPDAQAYPDPRAHKEQVAKGRLDPIKLDDIYRLELEAAPRLRAQSVHLIVDMLTEAPNFDFKTWVHYDAAQFQPPPPVMQLPSGAAHTTLSFLLDVLHIDESTYEGTDKVLNAWWAKLNIVEENRVKEVVDSMMVFITGDQLTVRLVRHLRELRRDELNSWNRLDNILPVFGWLHAVMALVRSIHEQFYSTAAQPGLAHAFNLLDRKGLAEPSTKGVFHQRLTEALKHVASAHFRTLWCIIGDVESLDQLRNKTPEELIEIAEKIYEDYATTTAIDKERSKPRGQRDDVLVQTMLFCRDILDPLILIKKIHEGDVGVMRDLLPRMLFRFIAGGNTNYTVEILETIQGFEREWTDEVKCVPEYIFGLEPSPYARFWILRFCWLGNFAGEGFQPFDLVLEHYVLALKVCSSCIKSFG